MTLKPAGIKFLNIPGDAMRRILVVGERVMQKTLGRNAEREQQQEKNSCKT